MGNYLTRLKDYIFIFTDPETTLEIKNRVLSEKAWRLGAGRNKIIPRFKPFQEPVDSRPFQGTPNSFPSSNSSSQVPEKLYLNSLCDQDLFTPPRLHKSSNHSHVYNGGLDFPPKERQFWFRWLPIQFSPWLLWLPGSMTKEETQDA